MAKAIVKVSINIQSGYGAPSVEELTEWARGAYIQAIASQGNAGGKVQISREWVAEED